MKRASSIAALTGLMLLVLPSLIWVRADASVWPWDPAYYGEGTLALWNAESAKAWLHGMTHALQLMPPLLVWIGQAFVPLARATGDLQAALLLQNILWATATLALVYRLVRVLGGGVTAGVAAMTVCGGAGLFIGLSHVYLTETLQAMTAALSMNVALQAEKRGAVRNASLVLALIALAMLAKVSSVLFVVPALVYVGVVQCAREPVKRTRGDIFALVGAVALMALAVAWYDTNMRYAVRHAVAASVGGEALAQRAPEPFAAQLLFWIGSLADAMTVPRLYALVLALIVLTALAVAAVRTLRGGRLALVREAVNTRALFGFYLTATVIVMLVAYALQTNQEQRYLAPVVPLVAGLVGWSLAQLRRLPLSLLVLAAGAANAAVFHAEAFGVQWDLMPPSAWLGAPDTSGATRQALARAMAKTCDRSGPHLVAVAADAALLNENTANFMAPRLDLACFYRKPPAGEDPATWLESVGVEDAISLQGATGLAVLLAADARFVREDIGPYVVFHRADFDADVPGPQDFQPKDFAPAPR